MTQPLPDAYDVLIVLGARVKANFTPSEALERRLSLALACYQARPVPVICCGAQGSDEPCSEGDFMCGWLQERGVPADMTLSEDGSYDTIQNLTNAKAIMQAKGFAKALVVTSDYHLRRALAICRRVGLEAEGISSPSSRKLLIKNHARELLAWVKYFITRI